MGYYSKTGETFPDLTQPITQSPVAILALFVTLSALSGYQAVAVRDDTNPDARSPVNLYSKENHHA